MTVKVLKPVNEKRFVWHARSIRYSASEEKHKVRPFICGPLPLDWFSKAGGLPGKTLHVALILWYLSGLNKSREVRLGSKQLAAFGVSRDAKYQALQRLRESGLVEVDQQPGRVPVVTILIIPDETSGKSGTKEEPIGKNMR